MPISFLTALLTVPPFRMPFKSSKAIARFVPLAVNKAVRKLIGKWAFYELAQFIQYKAKLYGVPVFFVNPRYTSQTCSNCGYVSKNNRKSQSLFICEKCGFSENADINASFNIAHRAKQQYLGLTCQPA